MCDHSERRKKKKSMTLKSPLVVLTGSGKQRADKDFFFLLCLAEILLFVFGNFDLGTAIGIRRLLYFLLLQFHIFLLPRLKYALSDV